MKIKQKSPIGEVSKSISLNPQFHWIEQNTDIKIKLTSNQLIWISPIPQDNTGFRMHKKMKQTLISHYGKSRETNDSEMFFYYLPLFSCNLKSLHLLFPLTIELRSYNLIDYSVVLSLDRKYDKISMNEKIIISAKNEEMINSLEFIKIMLNKFPQLT
ncbi:hypothetical protein KSF78_0007818 [Schistosoma japonicum]|nr:hypothetical protein KSF78_0007818 [Schistosoma japonicum]